MSYVGGTAVTRLNIEVSIELFLGVNGLCILIDVVLRR